MLNKLKPQTLFSKLILSYLVVILVTLLVLSGIMSYLVEEYFYGAREWEVNTQARKIADMLEEPLIENNVKEVIEKAQTLSRSMEAEIGVFDEQGENIVVVDYLSDENDEATVEFEDQEIEHVLMGNSLTKKVVGPQTERLLIAIPIYKDLNEYEDDDLDLENYINNPDEEFNDNDEKKVVVGLVSVSVQLAGIEDTIANISRITITSGGIAVLIAIIFALTLSKNITRPLSSINKSAQALAKGDFTKNGDDEISQTDDELGKISQTFNLAAQEIENNIKEQKRLAISRKNLVDNASHEFRGPLSSIRGYSELMLDGIVSKDDYDYYIQLIWKNAVELNKMVDKLLDLSTMESGKLNLEKELLYSREVIESSIETVTPMAEKKKQQIKTDKIENDHSFFGDRHRVKQIIVNLLNNAIQYTPEKGQIIVRSFKQDTWCAIQVEDNGQGIPEDEKPNIFQRFYKVDKSRERSSENKSSGLGLAIVNELVKLHNAKIEVKSEQGQGSVFTVYFPLYK
ncbi:sensor histidine kinase [Natranaerobius trueperi]|uniref:histidine kinase n=1 Tax=Natranaerobius trueperi TaxID=759412 RepID=A0A226BXD0_9FIRM|nr:HAMP domain-containing sensor histidine kinase [Natranaerobius trueperi]OWZ83571.1 hypothetical protein CDO51_07600 [Natranaerobius trueperi]